MNKIVKNGLVTDLHIHSILSKFKDGDIVSDNKLENIQVLINKLNINNVNICAITDHDAFSYDTYFKLKQEEGKGSIQKVLPGVEFTVMYTREGVTKPIHVVTIFNDKAEDKLKNIETILKFVGGKPQYDAPNSFSEKKFLEILNSIDLNCLCIAHQKNTLASKSPRKDDVSTLGQNAFNEFMFAEYFEAFEFKNRKHEVFNNIEKSKLSSDLLRFVTGSDCHMWSEYPKRDKDETTDFCFTYLKCLPTFKGVSLAMTEETRISLQDNFFNHSNVQINELKIKINDIQKDIPLSEGINVIIGDNSIGKSLLLHKITNYYRENNPSELSSLNTPLKKKYEDYLEINKVECISSLMPSNIFEFDTQGEIRKKFNMKLLKDNTFFKDKYPSDVITIEIINKVTSKINQVSNILNKKFDFDKEYNKISSITIPKNTVIVSSLSIDDIDTKALSSKETILTNLLTAISGAILKNQALIILLDEKAEIDKINEFLIYLQTLKTKYESIKNKITEDISVANCINTAFKEFNDDMSIIRSSEDRIASQLTASIKSLATTISDTLCEFDEILEINYDIEEIELKAETRDYHNKYTFIKTLEKLKLDEVYIRELFLHPLKVNKDLSDIFNMTEKDFIEKLSRFDNSSKPVDFYKNKLVAKMNGDFTNKETIIERDGDTQKEYSDGLNVRIYFDIISSHKYKNGLYIIDQPEDDISPSAIKEFVLGDFKLMSKERQLIIVTHNPQFVVNLDADNIVYLTRDKKTSEFKILSGALEYEDGDYNMLDIVASSLEGGIDSIRKRWKKYEKNHKY
ncbi:MAG: hypothetical protein JXR48_19115 [Candidatus Delongbacteria bacterium]|nr:hypothetical protein [Candidatus Delongbacteria bacterium]